jgi:fumarate hydratase subunit alpha
VARLVDFKKIAETVEKLCIEAVNELPDDVLDTLKKAAGRETNARAVKILNQLIENARIAAEEKIPLCQDTGLAVVFVEMGADVAIKAPAGKTIYDAINMGVQAACENGYLRKNVAAEPLGDRKNTGTNTPAIAHLTIVPCDRLKITVMTKGGGCENKSQFRMFRPTSETGQIIDWVVDVARQAGADACPPFIVGVGIGGNFETSCLLSKKALLRKLGDRHREPYYAKLEEDILSAVNLLGIGPQGFGGDTTALDCFIETAP